MIEVIKNISAVIGCAMSFIALCGVIIKPIRTDIAKWVKKIVGGSETVAIMKNMDDKLTDLNTKLERLDQRVFENERDRIRAELSQCAAQCRRGIPLYGDEMAHIEDIYDKYVNELHSNHQGTRDYDFIRNYYDSQDFSKLK